MDRANAPPPRPADAWTRRVAAMVVVLAVWAALSYSLVLTACELLAVRGSRETPPAVNAAAQYGPVILFGLAPFVYWAVIRTRRGGAERDHRRARSGDSDAPPPHVRRTADLGG